MHATKNNSADWDYFSTTSHLSYCNFLGHLIMPTNPPKHHDFNHQTPTKSNTKIWLQDSNKELELTERKRKKCSKVLCEFFMLNFCYLALADSPTSQIENQLQVLVMHSREWQKSETLRTFMQTRMRTRLFAKGEQKKCSSYKLKDDHAK